MTLGVYLQFILITRVTLPSYVIQIAYLEFFCHIRSHLDVCDKGVVQLTKFLHSWKDAAKWLALDWVGRSSRRKICNPARIIFV